jgi:PAS domain S-box-containing protein
MSDQSKSFQEIAAQLDQAMSMPDLATAALLELAQGLFPNGLPDARRVTWEEQTDGLDAAALKDPRADAEARLKAAEARFRTLAEQIPAVTFMAVLGEGKNEIYVSPHIETMLGYTQEEWLSDPFLWYWRLHPDDRQLWNDEFAKGCQTGGPFRADCRFLSRDDRIVWVHGEARLVKDELGRPMFLQGIAFDITEIKKAQELVVTEAVTRAKLQEELEIARRVQTSIVPKNISVPHLEIAARMIPAEDVGGDYYDVFPCKNARRDGCWIAIGDVAGHGIDAGLIMLMVQAACASLVRTLPEATPREIVTHLNATLYDNVRERLTGDSHVTFTLGRFRPDGTFLFTGAHEDIIVVRANGEIELFRPPGTWLAGRADVRSVTVDAMMKLGPGDIVVLYTDGVTEARSATREQWDIGRLGTFVAQRRSEPVETIVDAIFKEVAAWAPVMDDDRTVLVFRYRPETAE